LKSRNRRITVFNSIALLNRKKHCS